MQDGAARFDSSSCCGRGHGSKLAGLTSAGTTANTTTNQS